MTEDEMIKKIAKPILEQLKTIEKNYDSKKMYQIPQVKFVCPDLPDDKPFKVGDIEITKELLEIVEAYIEDEIEMIHQPTIFH